MSNYDIIKNIIIELAQASDWASVAQLATALNTGEWDEMSDEEQTSLISNFTE